MIKRDLFAAKNTNERSMKALDALYTKNTNGRSMKVLEALYAALDAGLIPGDEARRQLSETARNLASASAADRRKDREALRRRYKEARRRYPAGPETYQAALEAALDRILHQDEGWFTGLSGHRVRLPGTFDRRSPTQVPIGIQREARLAVNKALCDQRAFQWWAGEHLTPQDRARLGRATRDRNLELRHMRPADVNLTVPCAKRRPEEHATYFGPPPPRRAYVLRPVAKTPAVFQAAAPAG